MKKLSKTEIAERAGVSLSMVSRVFNKQRVPSIRTLQKLAEAMGISPTQLMKKLEL